MHYQTYPPPPELRDYVRFYWFLESDTAYTHHSLASVCPELIFHYDGQFTELYRDGSRELSFLSGISAATDRTRVFRINRGFGIFGTYLYPHSIPLLFGLPADELTSQMVDLDLLAGPTGKNLEERVMTCRSRMEMIRVLETFLLDRLRLAQTTPPAVLQAVHFIITAEKAPKVKQLSKSFFLSERQLERQFRQFTGFSPKQFIRIARFQRALQYYGRTHTKLGDIALDCGYYDQAHFANDFRQFSGLSPREYFSGRSAATDWKD